MINNPNMNKHQKMAEITFNLLVDHTARYKLWWCKLTWQKEAKRFLNLEKTMWIYIFLMKSLKKVLSFFTPLYLVVAYNVHTCTS